MSQEVPPPAPVIVKKFANRRLYSTEWPRYMSKADVSMMVRQRQTFIVLDMQSGNYITPDVLSWVQGVPKQ